MRPTAVLALLILALGTIFAACGGDDEAEPIVAIEPGATPAPMTLTSSAFAEGEEISGDYVCQGEVEGTSPPLNWSGTPAGTRSFVLVLESLRGERGNLQYWVVFDIDGDVDSLGPGQEVGEKVRGGTQARNGVTRENGYIGPCLAAGTPEQRFEFRIYALNTKLEIWDRSFLGDVALAMDGHVLAQGSLTAVYRP